MKALVTGAAGFLGSHLCDELLVRGNDVVGVDNLRAGSLANLEEALAQQRFTFQQADVGAPAQMRGILAGCDVVYHFAANADVRSGLHDPFRDLTLNTDATVSLVVAAAQAGVSHVTFASTSSVYGETDIFPTPEDAPFPVQTSLYGASKVAAEGFIQALATGLGFGYTICRFASVLGPRYSHGHVYDFCNALAADPAHLEVLGNGNQTKAYVHVSDLVAGVLSATEASESPHRIFNVASGHVLTVRESVEWICEELGVGPTVTYGSDNRGWIGDNPVIDVCIDRLLATGWRPQVDLELAVKDTVRFLVASRDRAGVGR